jgi:hypothetical protein
MGPYAGVDYNLTFVHSSDDTNTFTTGIGQPYAKVDFIPQSGTLDLASSDLLLN